MSFTANDYIVAAAELYGDTGYDRISSSTWIKHLNSAVRALVLVRPDAGAYSSSVKLSSGAKQDLPSDGIVLLDITRNMGTDGNTPGKIVTPSSRKHVDYSNVLWTAATGSTAIDNFAYDKDTPLIFYVTPPVSSTINVYVEMVYSKLPTAVSATGDSVGINDIYFEPIVQYMLYKAYITDDENVEFQKGTTFLQTFFNLLQIEMASANALGPAPKE